MQRSQQICLLFDLKQTNKQITDISVVLQKWGLISHTLACVGL